MDDASITAALVDAINFMPQTMDRGPLRIFSSGPEMTEGFRRVYPNMIIIEQPEGEEARILHQPKAAA